MTKHRIWTQAEDRKIRRYADSWKSVRQCAEALGLPVGTVLSRGRRLRVRFSAPDFRGGGCDRDAALRGWETRRAHARTEAV